MKKYLILINILCLLVGNTLFSSIHHLSDHHHSNEANEDSKCQECIIISDSNNYVSDFQEVNFQFNKTNLFTYKYFSIVKFNVKKKFLSRAPPIS